MLEAGFVMTTIIICSYIAHAQSCPDSSSCLYPPSCKRIPYINKLVNLTPRYYDVMASEVFLVPEVDNACTSVLELRNMTSLRIRVIVNADGSQVVSRFTYSAIPGHPGVYRGEGLLNSSACSTCVFNDYFAGELPPPCEEIYPFYRCYLFGDCVSQSDGSDVWIGYALQPKISDYCYSVLIDFVASFGLVDNEFTRFPQNLTPQCVSNLRSEISAR